MKDEYRFARACAVAWLEMQGIACRPLITPHQLAVKLGRLRKVGGKEEAKQWVIDWHIQAIAGNKAELDNADGKAFYASQKWRQVRYEALRRSSGRCELCGDRPGEHPLHVDHIKPRSKFPHLALQLSNLQVLCRDCNLGKGNRDTTNWRESARTA